MNSIRNIARLNEAELEKVIPPNASWHTDYRDTAYVHIGGLPLDLNEGDVLLIFSQYGNPTDVKLARDKDSGKSRGFGWLKYEDQRSCDLAVDNLSGASVLGRLLSVDHARYKMKDGERETVGEEGEDVTDREGEERDGKRRRSSESESEEDRPMIKEEVELATLLREHDEDDPMKAYLVQEKRKEVEEALKTVTISKPKQKNSMKREHRHHHHRSRRVGEDEEETGKDGHRSRRRERRSKDDGDDEDAEADARSSSRRRSASIKGKRKRERRIGRDDYYKPNVNGKQHNRSHGHHDSEDEDKRRRKESDDD